jgi:hypothetical protein
MGDRGMRSDRDNGKMKLAYLFVAICAFALIVVAVMM